MSAQDRFRFVAEAGPPNDLAEGAAEGRKASPAADPRDLLASVASVPLEAIPALLGNLEQLKAALWARLNEPRSTQSGVSRGEADESHFYLKPEEAARVLGVSVRWLYRHHRQLPFARKLSRKTLRFSESGLRRWQATRKA
jgi:predicted DNA-binding transcriptional regulator AlpA